ncbi:MAG TPA: hypothetical protein VLS88_15380, partial [Polyangiales bacterium]|nr:hypothetical protein [Polyangiales bacterium]
RSVMKPSEHGYRIRVGPHPSLNFPFVLLARALSHFDRVRAWAHAKQDLPPPIATGPKVLDQVDVDTRKRLTKTFASIRKKFRDVPREARSELRATVHGIVVEHAGSLD